MDVDIVQFSFDLLDPMVNEDVLSEIIPRTLDSGKKYGIRLQSCFTGGIVYNSNLLLHPSSNMRKWHAFDWYAKAINLSEKLHVETMGGHMGALTVKDFKDPLRRESAAFGASGSCHIAI